MGKGPDLDELVQRGLRLAAEGQRAEGAALVRSAASRMRDPNQLLQAHLLALSGGLEEESLEVLVEGAKRFREPQVHLALGLRYFAQKRFDLAVTQYRKVGGAISKIPQSYRDFALALVNTGNLQEGYAYAEKAYAFNPEPAIAYLYGCKLLAEFKFDQAVAPLRIALADAEVGARAAVSLARVEYQMDRPEAALEVLEQARKQGAAPSETTPLYAEIYLALNRLDDAEAAVASGANLDAESVLRFRAEVAVIRGDAPAARALLDDLGRQFPKKPGGDGLRDLVEGRYLAMVGRLPEAAERIKAWAEIDLLPPRFSWAARTMGELMLRQGRLGEALGWLERAAARNPRDPSSELLPVLKASLAQLRDSPELAGVESPQQAALRRLREQFEARDREVRSLRRQLDATQSEVRAREEQHRQELATVAAPEVIQQKVRSELEEREKEAAEKAEAAVSAALGPTRERCDPELLELLLLGERTYQTSLHTDLHPVAVAVHYCGALERALDVTLAHAFDRYLDADRRREEFLQGNVREMRGKTRVYRDRFAEVFDPALPRRSPGLGEWVRALEHRRDPSLAGFGRFLQRQVEGREALLDPLARFLQTVKETVRDPAAHGKAREVSQEDLLSLRHALLDEWEGSAPGLLQRLLAAPR